MYRSVNSFIDTIPTSLILRTGGAQEETYMVVELRDNGFERSTYKLEEVEFSRALFELYEGGVVRIHVSSSMKKVI